MFTGIIQQVGRVAALKKSATGGSLVIEYSEWGDGLRDGESIAVQGVCLTVTGTEGRNRFICDVLTETLTLTSLGDLKAGGAVNLERALAYGDRLGGHMVSGHVDGTGSTILRKQVGRDWLLRIGCSPDLMSGIVLKGSVAVNGVSLTVSDRQRTHFEVNVIPFTWENSTLNRLQEGLKVNLETDIIGKYVEQYGQTKQEERGLTLEDLRSAGYVDFLE